MIRRANAEDAVGLFEAERAATTTAFKHIFPAEKYPYPDTDVLARWELNLARADMTVIVDEQAGEITGYAATANDWLEHLGVVPELWGSGLASELHDLAMTELSGAGHCRARLWVLEANGRARRFYVRRSWQPTGIRGTAEFPPFPPEIEMMRSLTDDP